MPRYFTWLRLDPCPALSHGSFGAPYAAFLFLSAAQTNLIVTAIILWNTRYLERAVATLRQTEDIPDHLLAHLSPLGWEHINLTEDYIWLAATDLSENADGLRALRTPPQVFKKAA
jgi:hypothetical protein